MSEWREDSGYCVDSVCGKRLLFSTRGAREGQRVAQTIRFCVRRSFDLFECVPCVSVDMQLELWAIERKGGMFSGVMITISILDRWRLLWRFASNWLAIARRLGLKKSESPIWFRCLELWRGVRSGSALFGCWNVHTSCESSEGGCEEQSLWISNHNRSQNGCYPSSLRSISAETIPRCNCLHHIQMRKRRRNRFLNGAGACVHD